MEWIPSQPRSMSAVAEVPSWKLSVTLWASSLISTVFFPQMSLMFFSLSIAAKTPLRLSPLVILSALKAGVPRPFPSGPWKLLSASLTPEYMSKTSMASHSLP